MLSALVSFFIPNPRSVLLLRLSEEDTLRSKMFIASIVGDYKKVQELVVQNISPEIEDKAGRYSDCAKPIHYACQYGSQDVVKLLLGYKVEINVATHKNNLTPLHFAAQNGNLNVVELLINYGALIDSINWCGITPLQFAVQREHKDVACFLIKHGADYTLLIRRAIERKNGNGDALCWVRETEEAWLRELLSAENITLLADRHIDVKKTYSPDELVRKCISENTRHLVVSKNEIGSSPRWQYAQSIANRLLNHLYIIQLTMNDCLIGNEGLLCLAAFISETKSLTHLNLEGNSIQSVGLIEFLPAIEKNKTLIALNLHYNRINDYGAIAFTKVFKAHPTLKRLDFSANPMSGEAAFKIYSAFYEKNIFCSSCNLHDISWNENWDAVEVTIWTSPSNILNSFSTKFGGHVSLKTFVGGSEGKGIFASFWPPLEDDDKYELSKYVVAKFDSAYLRTEDYDKVKEQYCIPNKFLIGNLNILNINNLFEKFKSQPQAQWELFGDQRYGVHNCASLVLHLLRCGAGHQLIDPLCKKHITTIISPQFLIKLLEELQSISGKGEACTYSSTYVSQEQRNKTQFRHPALFLSPVLQRGSYDVDQNTSHNTNEPPIRESTCCIS